MRRQTTTERTAIGAARATGFGAIGALLLAALPAAAQDGLSWTRFPGTNYETSSTGSTDRDFQKQWEAAPPKGFPTLSPRNLEAMKVAIKRYSDVTDRGGFPVVPDIQMQQGLSNPAVAVLRRRLTMSGDLTEGATFSESSYGSGIEKAVKRFQASNGLTPTGIVDKRTVAALNVPSAARLRQLKTNSTRLTALARSAAKKYIVVNIPAAQIEAVEGDKVISRHSGVVGKVDRQTPLITSQIHELNFNPVWHLPPTVISQDLVPKGRDMQRRNQDVLAKFGIDAYDAAGKKVDTKKINWSAAGAGGYAFRQQPGPENPLGFVKINFHNQHSVYMHSTPSETLFGRNFRAASSGCVRIAGIDQLVTWIMSEQGWTNERVLKMKSTGERFDARLKRPIPLYFAYITAWATEDGVIQFRRDIYNKDGVGPMASAY